MITIRLKKIATKKNLSYSIVVSSQKIAPTSSKFLEKIGHYKPLADKWSNKYFFIDTDRLLFWLQRGARVNNTFFLVLKPLLYSFPYFSKKKII